MNVALRAILFAGALALTTAACSSAGSIGPGGGSTGPGGGSVGSGGNSGGGSGSTGGDPGDGSGGPRPSDPGPGGQAPPIDGKATIVVPKPGRLDAHPVGASTIEVVTTKPSVVIKLTWWSGVAPCTVLDSVTLSRAGSDIRLTIREGADQRGVACIDIAMLKAALVDLGPLAPGTYSVSAGDQAPPIEVVVS